MNKNVHTLKKSAWIARGIYLILCAAEIAFCILHGVFHGTAFGYICMDIAFWLVAALFFLPFMPLSLFWDIRVLRTAGNDRKNMKKQLFQTIVSPIAYVLLWLSICTVFILSTGGL